MHGTVVNIIIITHFIINVRVCVAGLVVDKTTTSSIALKECLMFITFSAKFKSDVVMYARLKTFPIPDTMRQLLGMQHG